MIPTSDISVAAIAARLLVVEDDTEVNQAICDALRHKGYHVHSCVDGKQGLMAALGQSFHLMILDKMLPSIDGLSLLRRLREHKDTPVIMLTACGAEQDRITGFHSGADDYLPKPFSMTELLLRVDALLRRSLRMSEVRTSSLITIGQLKLDSRQQVAWVMDERIELTPLEYELLYAFLSQPQEVLTKPYLYQLVLHKPFSRYDRSLDMHISNLRAKLTGLPASHPSIKTVRGKGYCFQ